MRVVATQGDGRYLISLEDDMAKVNADPRAQGQVLSLRAGRLYPPFNIHSIYKFGYWEDCELSSEQLDALLAEVERTGPAYVKTGIDAVNRTST